MHEDILKNLDGPDVGQISCSTGNIYSSAPSSNRRLIPGTKGKGGTMYTRVQFADEIEPLVQFIEETAPSDILDQTLAKLRAGVPLKTMLTASALAVTRSSDLPPGHHGGPLHPLVGLHAVYHLVGRLEGENRFLPVLQHVALANKHIHHPAMGPYMLPDFEPVNAGGVEATKEAFFTAVNRGEYNAADHYFLWLWDNMTPVEALDT